MTMDICIHPQKLKGTLPAIPSKSQAHRLLICAAFADKPTEILCPDTNRDIEATAACLNALGSCIRRTETGYAVLPAASCPSSALLPCQDSGSTLRFLLPIAGALGIDTVFQMTGRLPERPLSPLWEEMERMGCKLSRPTADTLRCQGKLSPGEYHIAGNVSSQFITGLLLALTLLPDKSRLHIEGPLESAPYVTMTQRAMTFFGVDSNNFVIPGTSAFVSPGICHVEGDWSNAAFFLAAKELGNDVCVTGLDDHSPQGDRACRLWLPLLKEKQTIDASNIPDLIPILAVVAACNHGAVFQNIQRLRIKESDRVASILDLLHSLGGRAEASPESLTVYQAELTGGTVDSHNDHRIAMAAAIAATVCKENVVILGAQCVEKSYPSFFEEYKKLGGCYEQYLR